MFWETCHHYFHLETKQWTQHWPKLQTHITFITNRQSTRENAITIHNRNISIILHQHGFTRKHSTHTALHSICQQLTKEASTIQILRNALLLWLWTWATFDTANIHKRPLKNISNIIITFIADYIKKMTSMHSIQPHVDLQFIQIFILLTRWKATEGAIHKANIKKMILTCFRWYQDIAVRLKFFIFFFLVL